MILVFDMDDTLFSELDYVRSGFRAVVAFLEQTKGVSPQASLPLMEGALAEDRSHIFDKTLSGLGLSGAALKHACVQAYRRHVPAISLYPEADTALERFAKLPLYVVTDGHTGVQAAKVKALGLEKRVKRCLLTYRYGKQHAKPSPYCFEKIAAWEKSLPDQVIYVADNPRKDFVGIRPLGFKTIRVHTGQHASVAASPQADAAHHIASLAELTPALLTHVLDHPA
jgi:putative hydrolase of the HAD superfamily